MVADWARITPAEAIEFRAFCEAGGHRTREHPDFFRNGYLVQYKGHWMGVVWNKNWRRYTIDCRLEPIMQALVASKIQEKFNE